MFKKPFKVSNSHALSNKDKKNLKQQLEKLDYDEEIIKFLLTDVDESSLMIDKLAGSKQIIY